MKNISNIKKESGELNLAYEKNQPEAVKVSKQIILINESIFYSLFFKFKDFSKNGYLNSYWDARNS